jgi:hypothetical protein
MRLYQCHLEGEFKPFQRIGPRNIQLGPGRLEPISKREDNLGHGFMPRRIDILQVHRITAVAHHLGVFQGIVFFLKEALW